MNCDELRTLLHGYVDGELDLVHHLDAERHLDGCPACAEACRQLRALREALQDRSLRFTPPPGLRRRVAASLGSPGPLRRYGPWLAVAASVALLALGAWAGVRFAGARGGGEEEDRLAEEVVASHVRSLMAEHLTDKPSGKNHEVKPWFQGRLDFTPPVWNLSDHGFTLKGGRLDYFSGRAAAALVYKRRLHTINLLIWREPGAADAAPETLTRQGYHLVRWAQGGMEFWAVSDLNAGELREFAELVRRQPPQ